LSTKTESAETRRGRPRPQDTIKRDEDVRKALQAGGPQTRDEVAKSLSIKPSHAYLSLIRLRRDGLANRGEGDAHAKWVFVA
jgi:hypothetical protein